MHNGINAKAARPLWQRSCLIASFTLFGLAVAAVIVYLYGERTEEIYIGSPSFAFSPVYNRNGSWLHGQLEIGYRPEALLLEHSLALLLLCYLIRFIDFASLILGMGMRWSFCAELGLAATIARIINVVSGKYTLDYIYIARLHGTFDLVDFYLGISMAVMLVWTFLCEVRFLRLKKRSVGGMGFVQRMKWELVFTKNVCRAAFIPREQWEGIREQYGYYY